MRRSRQIRRKISADAKKPAPIPKQGRQRMPLRRTTGEGVYYRRRANDSARRYDRARSPHQRHYMPSPCRSIKKRPWLNQGRFNEMRQRPTLPYSVPYSTIGSMWLNFRVRNENGWIPHDIITAMVCSPQALSPANSITY